MTTKIDGKIWTRHPTRPGVLVCVGIAEPPKARRKAFTTPRVQPDLWKIAQKIMDAVGNCIPDCDPIDMLAPYVRRLMGEDAPVTPLLDKAARKHLCVKSYNQYLIDAWDGWNEVCEPDQRMDNPWR